MKILYCPICDMLRDRPDWKSREWNLVPDPKTQWRLCGCCKFSAIRLIEMEVRK